MNYAPFDVLPVADRLRAKVTGLRLIGLAADYATVKNLRDFNPPSAYVVLAQERFEPRETGQAIRGQQRALMQRSRVTLGVIVAARNYREQAGAQLSGTLRELLQEVRAAVGGWTPDVPGARPLQLQRGDLLQYDEATALWCDVWTTQSFIGAEAR